MATLHRFMVNRPGPAGELPGWELTSVVMSEDEFEQLLAKIEEVVQSGVTNARTGERAAPKGTVESLRQARHIPMLARGIKTESIFQYLGVETRYASVIIRGEGERLAGETWPELVQN